MIAEWGECALIAAGVTSLFYVFFAKRLSGLQSSLWIYSSFFFISMAMLSLWNCFFYQDLSVQYVAAHSHQSQSWFYRLAALWGGHEGSLLLWIWIQGCWILALNRACMAPVGVESVEKICCFQRDSLRLVMMINAFLIFFLLFYSSPFSRLLPYAPTEGQGLNPLLQDPLFVIHPPILYLGYIGFSLPFVMTLSAWIHSLSVQEWLKHLQSFIYIPFMFLTLGIGLGSFWAYYELGWGGYWFWDPVENVSLVPWLLSVAWIHSLMSTRKTGALPLWSMTLSVLIFMCCWFGTLLVRSGLLTSVHSFASDPQRGLVLGLGWALLWGAILWAFMRYDKNNIRQQSDLEPRSLFFLFQNYVVLSMAFLIALGTMAPLITSFLGAGTISVGAPYFNTVLAPLLIVWMALMVGVWGSFFWGIVLGGSLIIGALLDEWMMGAIAALGLCLIGQSLWLVWRKPSAYTVALAHGGLGLFLSAMVWHSLFRVEHDKIMGLGDVHETAGHYIELQALESQKGPLYEAIQGHFVITNPLAALSVLEPEKRYYAARDIVTTKTAIDSHWAYDLYIALGTPLEDGQRWSVRLYYQPGIRYLWLGILCIVVAAASAQRRSTRRARYALTAG